MRISYVIPGNFSSDPERQGQLQHRQARLQGWAFAGTEVSAVDIPNGISSIECAYEELLAAPAAIDRIRGLEAEGCDAAIIGCFGDPGLDAARELVSMPVIGPGEASLLLAAQLGHRIGILAVFESLATMHRTQAYRAGVRDKFCGIRALEIPVLELGADERSTFARMVDQGRAALSEDGADVLILGCMSLSFLDLAPRLSHVLEVPVINPALTALKAAESLASIGLSHSKIAYPLPPKLRGGQLATRAVGA